MNTYLASLLALKKDGDGTSFDHCLIPVGASDRESATKLAEAQAASIYSVNEWTVSVAVEPASFLLEGLEASDPRFVAEKAPRIAVASIVGANSDGSMSHAIAIAWDIDPLRARDHLYEAAHRKYDPHKGFTFRSVREVPWE